jgi:hypothetical protein
MRRTLLRPFPPFGRSSGGADTLGGEAPRVSHTNIKATGTMPLLHRGVCPCPTESAVQGDTEIAAPSLKSRPRGSVALGESA